MQSEIYAVPGGVRLLIEYVTFAHTSAAHGDTAVQRPRIGTTIGGELVWHDVMSINGRADWSGESQLVKSYADPNSRRLRRRGGRGGSKRFVSSCASRSRGRGLARG